MIQRGIVVQTSEKKNIFWKIIAVVVLFLVGGIYIWEKLAPSSSDEQKLANDESSSEKKRLEQEFEDLRIKEERARQAKKEAALRRVENGLNNLLGRTQLVIGENWENNEYTYRNKWSGSEKEVRVKIRAKVKYGYDFKNMRSMRENLFERREGFLRTDLPEPSILSIDVDEDSIETKEESGIWNKVQGKDVEAAIRECKSDLRRNLERQEEYKEKVNQEMERQIRRLYEEEELNIPKIEIRSLD